MKFTFRKIDSPGSPLAGERWWKVMLEGETMGVVARRRVTHWTVHRRIRMNPRESWQWKVEFPGMHRLEFRTRKAAAEALFRARERREQSKLAP